jgi:hypothetical protein
MTYQKIDGDTDAMLRQSGLISDAADNFQSISQGVTGSVGDGVAVSAGRWSDRLGEVEQDRHGVVVGRVAPRYQEGADGLRAGQADYLEGDAAAAQASSRVTYVHGIANQI